MKKKNILLITATISIIAMTTAFGKYYKSHNFDVSYKKDLSTNEVLNKQNNDEFQSNDNSSSVLSTNDSDDYSGQILHIDSTSEESIFKKMPSLSEISSTSDLILSGKIINVKTEYNNSIVYRLVTLEVSEVFKGDYKNKNVSLFLVGGELNNDKAQDFAYSQLKDKVKNSSKDSMPKKVIYNVKKEISDLGEFKLGENMIVFLAKYPVNGDETIFLPVGDNQGIYKEKDGIIEIINQVEKINNKDLKNASNSEKKIKRNDFINYIREGIK